MVKQLSPFSYFSVKPIHTKSKEVYRLRRRLFFKYGIIGALAGTANGLFGSGGGLFLVPLLIKWTAMEEKRAFATSVAVIVPLSVCSFVVFVLKNGFDPAGAWPYLLGGVLGGILSGILFKRVSAVWLHRLFGILLLVGGIKAVLLL